MPLDVTQQQLAAEHVGLARRMARHRSTRTPWLADELESAALIGLTNAAAKYDEGRGISFATLAGHHIRGAMLDAQRNMLPAGYRRAHGEGPRTESLHTTIELDGKTAYMADIIPAEEEPVGWEVEAHDALERQLRFIPERNRQAIRLYMTHAGITLKEIGRQLHRSEGRVSQLINEGITMLKEHHGVNGTTPEPEAPPAPPPPIICNECHKPRGDRRCKGNYHCSLNWAPKPAQPIASPSASPPPAKEPQSELHPELAAMQAVAEALLPLEPAARQRVLAWVGSRALA